MTEKTYNKIAEYFRTHDKAYFLLRIIYKYLPLIIYLLYPVLLINTIIEMVKTGNPEDFVKTFTIPAVTLVSVTALRMIINKPRPYEAMNITPLITKDTKGKSFPSRHAASIFTIAMASFTLHPALAYTLLAVGVVMISSRVIAGVHYISDVIAGALFAVTLAVIGLYL